MAQLETATNALYEAPLDGFTAERDKLARELRGQGEREAADSVKRMRKPSVAAWAVNQLRHRHPERLAALLEAGERLRAAQEGLLAGGERGTLRDAVAQERALVDELTSLAAAELERAGSGVGPGIRTKIHATLHAAAGSQEVRDELAAGRLIREHQLGDLGLPGSLPSEPRRARTRGSAPKRADNTAQRRALERRLEKAQARRDERRVALDSATGESQQADRALAQAKAAAQRAEAALARARSQLDGAAESVRSVEAELDALGS